VTGPEFRSYNTETLFGYGDADEAARFAEMLNAGREINVYGEYVLSEAEVAENNLTERDDIIVLQDELASRDE
jgi:hypothetical protein